MDRIDLNDLDPAVEPTEEKFHRAARVAVASIPVAGALALEFLNSVLEPPLSKRRNEILIQIGEAVNALIDEGLVTKAGLQHNEAFLSTVSEACNISMRNHQEEKLTALRNAVVNSALPSCPKDDYRQIFLNFVDTSTVSHIRLLKLFENPREWLQLNGRNMHYGSMVSLSQVVAVALPALHSDKDILNTVWADLYQKGLVEVRKLDLVVSQDSCLSKQTTEFGSKLIAFLS